MTCGRSLTWRTSPPSSCGSSIAFALLPPARSLPQPLAHATLATWSVAAGAFAVYFGIHAIGLQTAANRLMAAMADTAAMSERTEALLLVPFSVLTSIWIGIFGLRLLPGRSPFRAPADGITVA